MYTTWRARWPSHLAIRYGATAAVCLLLCIVFLLHPSHTPEPIRLAPELFDLVARVNVTNKAPSQPDSSADIGIVMAKTRREDVNWLLELHTELPFKPFIYSVETPPEPGCLVPRSRKGRETSPYLSYIIDNYDSLPYYSIFVHSKGEQWHNDILGQKTADTIKALRFGYVNATGFSNLRCALNPGCPVGVNPLDPTEEDIRNKDTRARFADIYMDIFQVTRDKVPRHIGNVCCAQFAVTRARILQRPRLDYERMLQWAEASQEGDFGVGWVFEKIWHIIFGMEAIYCPRYEQCRCDNYGWCGPLSSGETLQPSV